MPTASWMPSPAQLEEARSPRVSNAKLAGRWGVNRATVSRVRAGLGIVMTRQGVAEGYVPGEDDGEADEQVGGAQREEGRPDEDWGLIPETMLRDEADFASMDPSELWDVLKQMQAAQAKLDPEREEGRVTIQTDKPILVIYSSDWHIGASNCEMQQLEDDLNLVAQTPGVYLIPGGDLMNNVIGTSHMGMIFEALTAARFERMVVSWLMERIKDRVPAVIGGNHPGWSEKVDDMHPEQRLAHELGAVYFGPFGMLHLTVGAVTYDLLLGHKFRMNSTLNRTHAAKRFMDTISDADVVFLGDKHAPATESTDVRQRERVFSQAGSYLRTSRFGRQLGFPNARHQMPGCVLMPDQKHVIPFKDAFRDGIHALAGYRKDFACPCEFCAPPKVS